MLTTTLAQEKLEAHHSVAYTHKMFATLRYKGLFGW